MTDENVHRIRRELARDPLYRSLVRRHGEDSKEVMTHLKSALITRARRSTKEEK